MSSTQSNTSFPWLLELVEDKNNLNIKVNTEGLSPSEKLLTFPNIFPDKERTEILSKNISFNNSSSSCLTRNKRKQLLENCKAEGRDW